MDRLEKYEDWARACMHVRCGFCRENCPAYNQLQLDSYAAKGKMTILYHLLKGNLDLNETVAERVFACTSCGLCDVACGYNQSEAIHELKTVLYDQGVALPEGYMKISTKTRESGNPYSADTHEGSMFLQSIPESALSSADYTLFLGCTQIYRERDEIDSLLKILRAAGVSFRTPTEQICCGSPTYRVGDEVRAREQAEKINNLFKKMDSEEILVSCAGCYRMLSRDYETLLNAESDFKFSHTMEFLQELIQDDKLEIKHFDAVVTYHDPCHLSRHSEIYEAPRQILSSIPGITLVEMEWNRKFAKCCGAGGGFRSGRSEEAVAVAANRVREAEDTGASILVTACPFCLRNLRDGAESIKSSMKIESVESLLADLV
ncbi:MAG: (Fe-S)-binding protein [Candidatus Thorarchaeota archaeon]|jgi:Fe-S oxidoreductase